MTLTFLPITPDLEFDCRNYSLISDVLHQVLEMCVAMKNPEPWCGYIAVTEEGKAIGSCAFKGPPGSNGEVELAWFTFAPYEGRGYGKLLAAELVRIAGSSGEVKMMIAKTPPGTSASTRICEHAGFALAGEFQDPEDGPVWHWERPAA